MNRAAFLVPALAAALAAGTSTLPIAASAQVPAGVPIAPVPEVAAELPQTPVEISAVKENGLFRLRTTQTSLALYTYDADGEDRSACTGRCAENWPPVFAPAEAQAMGEWKPIPRADGRRQWAFRGRPVYSYRGDTPTRSSGDGLGGQWHLVQPITLAPAPAPTPVALSVEGTGPAIPAGVGIGKSASGPVFTDLHGFAVYAFARDTAGQSACLAACAQAWPPLAAPAGAVPVGDWTIVARGDGSRQWAYKGRPAYIYARDKPNGGALGHGQGGVWHLMTF